jgi:uncharacterized membrane protein
MTDPRRLLVLGFKTPIEAREALLAMMRRQQEGSLLLHDAVFVSKDDGGRTHVQETTDLQPGNTALGSSVWGALIGTIVAGPVGTLVGAAASAGIGALVAKIVDIGVPDAKVAELRECVRPGTTALALQLSHVKDDALAAELARFPHATVVQSDLPAEVLEAIASTRGD